MTRTRVYRTDALILRRVNTGETDRILTVLTPNLGKLKLLTKGVRKFTSRKSGHIELFMLSDMLVARGRTFDIITQIDTLQTFRYIRESLEKTSSAYYIAELVDLFLEEGDVNKSVFELLIFTLTTLNHTNNDFLVLRYFELQLLRLMGFQPQLHFCVVSDNPLQAVDNNYFSYVDGGIVSSEHAQINHHTKPISLAVLKVLRFMQTQSWDKITNLQLTPATCEQVETVLLGYITYILERRLKSVNFIHQLRRGG